MGPVQDAAGDQIDVFDIVDEVADIRDDLALPYKFKPRPYQYPFWKAAVEDDVKRIVCVWHRRAGKDKTFFNAMLVQMMKRVGNYAYLFPTFNQGRRAFWEQIDADGFRTLDHALPVQAKRNNTTMTLTTINGSTFSVLGTDESLDGHRGTNYVGVGLSEFSYQDPGAFSRVFRPILVENGGFAWFNWTPQGRNHAFTMDKVAQENERWFYSKLTVEETKREDGTPVVTEELIDQERAEGVEEEVIQQEYYCSYDASIRGAYYAEQMRTAWAQGRIARIPIEETLDVHTFWDLGMDDHNAIWLMQAIGKEVRMVDYYENSGEGMTHYIQWCKDWAEKNNVRFGRHYAPFDMNVREYSSGVSRKDSAAEQGFQFDIAPKLSIQEGIDRCRRLFSRCYWDAERCSEGISALTDYRKAWDDKLQTYQNKPLHNYASHGADAFRVFGVVWSDYIDMPPRKTACEIRSNHNPFEM